LEIGDKTAFDIMVNQLLTWVALLAGLVFLVVDKPRKSGALTLAYFLLLSLGHVPGVLAYLDPNMISENAEFTKVGFNVTLMGMTAFIAGAIAARVFAYTSAKPHQIADVDVLSRVGRRMLTLGILAFFLLSPVSALLPSTTGIASALVTFLILGFWVRLYAASITHDRAQILLMLMVLPSFPLTTLVTGGFIGYGMSWALSIVTILFVVSRNRTWFYLAAPPVVFLGLSLFVTYAQQRDEIREVVWIQNAGMTQRLNQVSKLVTDFQLLDLSNEGHLNALDTRLNQNSLVGVGVIRHRDGEAELRYGATVPLWALIPRAIWPEKPGVGGSGDLVSTFTGIKFAEGTSVGVGQVLEFYMNFGIPGVLFGFAVFGFLLMRLDQQMMYALTTGDINGLLIRALPGLALLQPMGSLLEILISAASAVVVSRVLVHFKLLPMTRRLNATISKRPMRVTARR
jgi:hypothetical protein